jgi:enamine deaminase RidA (YjgF/YER057c/UK114 family)
MKEILRLRADTAENAEDALDEERRLDEAAVDEMRQIVKVTDVIASSRMPRSI